MICACGEGDCHTLVHTVIIHYDGLSNTLTFLFKKLMSADYWYSSNSALEIFDPSYPHLAHDKKNIHLVHLFSNSFKDFSKSLILFYTKMLFLFTEYDKTS